MSSDNSCRDPGVKGGSQLSSLQLAQNRLGFVQLSIQKPETAFLTP